MYLGIKIFYGASRVEQSDIQHHASMRKVFGQGLLTNALNPKVALFFMAFLPQFIAPDSSAHFIGFLLLGLTFVLTSTIWGFCLAYASATISRTLRDNPRYLMYLNRFTGTLLVGLGVRLALDR